jgi:hypothetical protein
MVNPDVDVCAVPIPTLQSADINRTRIVMTVHVDGCSWRVGHPREDMATGCLEITTSRADFF